VDWFLHDTYGSPVEVDLEIMNRHPKTLRKFDTIHEAVDWAVRFFRGRGLKYWCDIDLHQRRDDTHITLHCVGIAANLEPCEN
jgi:hypothetical protein